MISAALSRLEPIKSGITNSDGWFPILTITDIESFLATVSFSISVCPMTALSGVSKLNS